MHCLIYILFFAFTQEIPFKDRHEFEVKLDYQFKQRPGPDHNTVQLGSFNTNGHRAGLGVLPYLVLHIKMLELPSEKTRMKITTNAEPRPVFKKISANSIYELDLGFTADMIDRVKAHEYTLTFLDDDKRPVDRILIAVEEDGSFFVNGEKRGQF